MRSTAGSPVTHDEDGSTKTPYILIWAFLTLVWSIFTPPHKTFAARVLLCQPLWGVRMYMQEVTWAQDLVLFLGLHAMYGLWSGSWRFLTMDDFAWVDLNNRSVRIYLEVFSLLGVCGIMAGGIVHRGHKLKSTDQNEPGHQLSIDEQLLPPLIITSRTSHSRLFPKKHAFSYSYLFVGIPVGIRGQISSALSVDCQRQSWFHVRSMDYLSRGRTQSGLAEKLKRFLHTQGVTDRDYAFAYLVTAPRFLGYSFNPVSFWYLYDSDTTLKYVILEVNNTFDERRIYLLRADTAKPESGITLDDPSEHWPDEVPKKLVFTETFDKDFHVSPFNSRKGTYSLRATDPLAAYQETGQVQIDNTIVLRSSKESPKIVARVYSEGKPKEAACTTNIDLAKFIAAWWWVGFVTFPRIVWQAQKLFFRRKLHVWYRPEVTETSIGRAYTDDERHLEGFFRAFLEYVMEHVEKPMRLIYEPAHADGEQVALYTPGFTYEEDHKQTLTLQVQSPAFYGRFVHYAHAKEAFDRECLATDEKNRTLVIKNPGLLPNLLDAMAKGRSSRDRRKREPLEPLRWSWLKTLRCPPPAASYPGDDDASIGSQITDIRSFKNSELDIFVKAHCEDASVYRRIVTKLFLAQRFTLGLPELVAVLDWMTRGTMLLAAMYYCDHSKAVDVFRPRNVDIGDVSTVAITLILANAVHIWSLVKG